MVSPSVEAAGEDRWLEHLTGAHSHKSGYFGRWRRTRADLERALRSLQEVASALSATTQGPEQVARGITAVASHHFADAWTVMMVGDVRITSSRPAPEQCRAEDGGQPAIEAGTACTYLGRARTIADEGQAGSCDLESDVVNAFARQIANEVTRVGAIRVVAGDDVTSARVIDPGGRCGLGEVVDSVLAVGAPLVMDSTVTGSLVVVLPTAGALDQSDLAILSILANQAAVAFDAARRYEEQGALHRQALEGWEEVGRIAAALKARNQQLEQAHTELDLATRQHLLDQERRRIAGELHDSVIQHLVSIGMSLEWSRRATSEPRIADCLTDAHQLSRMTLDRLRRAIFELSCVGEGGIEVVPVLRELAGGLRSRAEVRVVVRGESTPLAVPLAHAVFHIAQEAVFNAVNHGGAGRVWIEITTGRHSMSLGVADDGSDATVLDALLESCGDESSTSPYHRGLSGIRRRAAEIGGTLSVVPRRGGGARLRLRAPICLS
ncbi:MAG: histidine kinase [Actinomycetota bacterium]|nr:histidine kinase [Actinomycetota bacterium]